MSQIQKEISHTEITNINQIQTEIANTENQVATEDSGSECSEDEEMSGSECSEDESLDPAENQDILTDDDRLRIQQSTENILVLQSKMDIVTKQIEILTKQLIDSENAHPLLYPYRSASRWESQYNDICRRHDAHLKSMQEYENTIKPIEAEIVKMKAEVAKKSKLRGREPNYNIPNITNLEERLAWVKAEKEIRIIPSLTEAENKFRMHCNSYAYYTNYYNLNVGKTVTAIKRRIALLESKLSDLKNCMDEDMWLGKYLVYARRHGLSTCENDIFIDCNTHYMDHVQAGDPEFDCPCNADPTSEDELEYLYGDSREYYPHVWSGGRCNRGTKMCLEVEDLPIGFIECKNPLDYCRPRRT